MDRPKPDPAARAAADVELLLSEASGLQRIVEVARALDGGGLGAAPPESEAPGEDPGWTDGALDGTDGPDRSVERMPAASEGRRPPGVAALRSDGRGT